MPIPPPDIAVLMSNEMSTESVNVKNRITYDLRKSNDIVEEREERCSSLSNLIKLSSDLLQINNLIPEGELLVKRSSSFSKLEELTGNLIEAGRIEKGFSADVNNSLGNLPNLPVSEENDKEFHKELLEGATSINPRDNFITVNNRFNSPGIGMTSNLSRTSSRLPTRGLSRLTPTVHTRHEPLRGFSVRGSGSD